VPDSAQAKRPGHEERLEVVRELRVELDPLDEGRVGRAVLFHEQFVQDVFEWGTGVSLPH